MRLSKSQGVLWLGGWAGGGRRGAKRSSGCHERADPAMAASLRFASSARWSCCSLLARRVALALRNRTSQSTCSVGWLVSNRLRPSCRVLPSNEASTASQGRDSLSPSTTVSDVCETNRKT